jgi:hypothetical protein
MPLKVKVYPWRLENQQSAVIAALHPNKPYYRESGFDGVSGRPNVFLVYNSKTKLSMWQHLSGQYSSVGYHTTLQFLVGKLRKRSTFVIKYKTYAQTGTGEEKYIKKNLSKYVLMPGPRLTYLL